MSDSVKCAVAEVSKTSLKIVESSGKVQYDSMEDMVKDYVELKNLIAKLEQAKKALNEQMANGLQAFGIDSFQLKVDELNYQLRKVSREYHSCNWDGLKMNHPDIYSEFVVDAETSYVEVRQVKEGSSKSKKRPSRSKKKATL